MKYMDQYRNLQQFTSVKEFDKCRSSVFYQIKDKLSKGALAVWNELAQRSTDVPGVCWVQIDTLAESVGLSRSTVERAIRLFKKLGVIQVVETIRAKLKGFGANVYVFQKLGEGSEMKGRSCPQSHCGSKDEPVDSETDTKIFYSKQNNNNHLNIKKRNPYIKFVPKSLQHYQAIFGKQVKDLYGRVWLAVKKLGITVEQEEMQQIGLIALEQVKQYVKAGKVLTVEEQCKVVYTIAHNQLEQRLDRGEVLDFNYEYDRLVKLGVSY
jgi:DNA-binding transcriptional regulator LsrR (DeoR family)